jgi:hypothetical protein
VTRLASAFRRACFPVPAGWVAAYLAGGVACTVLASGVIGKSWVPMTWSQFDVNARETTVLLALGSLALGGACHLLFAPANVAGPPTAGRPVARRVARVMAVCWCAGLVAYAVGIVPLAVRLALTATGGSPDLLAVAADAAALMVWAPVGLAAATLFNSLWGVAAGAVALGAAAILPGAVSTGGPDHRGVPWLIAAPWRLNGLPPEGWELPASVSVPRALLFLLGAGAAAAVAALWLRRWTPAFSPSSLAALLLLAVPLGAAGGLTALQAGVVRPDPDAPVVCAPVGGGGSTACVNVEASAALPELTALAEKALALAGPDGVPVLVLGNGARATEAQATSFGQTVAAPADLPQGREGFRRDVAIELARGLIGADSPECLEAQFQSGGETSEEEMNEYSAALEIAFRVSGRRENSPLPTGLEQLSDADLARWVKAHRSALAVCAVTDSDMP